MSAYPDALPTLREVENDPGVAYDPLQKNVVFAEDVNNIAAEILAIANELGTLPKGSFADVKTRLADMTSKTAAAQSMANSKAKKKNDALRIIYKNSLISDWMQSTTTQNTPYTVKTDPGAADFVAPFELDAATKFNGAIIDFECFVRTENVQWIEVMLYDGDTAITGWLRLNASSTTIAYSKISIGTTLAAGEHTISAKVRRTGAAATYIRILDPSFTIYERQDD